MSDTLAALASIHNGRATAESLESQTLDFKRQSDSTKDSQHVIAEAAACFANSGGGTIVVGVADSETGSLAFLGTDLDPVSLRRRIHEVTDPHLDVRVEEIFFSGVRLLEVSVQEGLDVHSARQRVTRRLEDQCLPMTTAEISRLHEERRGGDWSAGDSGRSLSSIDSGALLQIRLLLRRVASETLRLLGEGDVESLVAALGLSTSSGTLTRAGELLLCHDVDEPGREVLVYQHRETMGGEVNAGRRWSGPLITGIVELLAFIEARLGTTPINLHSGQQIQIEDYPFIAVREAIANAVMHGDHRDHRPVCIEHSPEVMEVRSPGPLVSGISPSNILTHPPKPRFPSLAEALRSLGLAEKWGQGVDRMYREMIRTGRSVPSVSVQEGAEPETVVRFHGGAPNTRVTKFIATLPDFEQNDTDTLLTISILVNRRTVNADQLAAVLQRDRESTQAVLHRLSTGEAQLIEPTPRSSNRSRPDYRLRSSAVVALGPALPYQSRPTVDRDRKIYDHVREYGSINNGAIQRMFDLDVYLARNVLQDLVGREALVRTSEQTRGRSVKYGPGPKFPNNRTK